MSSRFCGVRVRALAFPPLSPPARPLRFFWRLDSLTESSASPIAISTISLANWFGSRGRFAMSQVCHNANNPQRMAIAYQHLTVWKSYCNHLDYIEKAFGEGKSRADVLDRFTKLLKNPGNRCGASAATLTAQT